MAEYRNQLLQELVDAVEQIVRKEQSERLRDIYLIGDIDKDTARTAIERLRELANGNSRHHDLHQQRRGSVTDGLTLQMQGQICRVLADRSGKPLRQIIRDTKRNDFYLDAVRARSYGLIAGILGPDQALPSTLRTSPPPHRRTATSSIHQTSPQPNARAMSGPSDPVAPALRVCAVRRRRVADGGVLVRS